MSEERRGVEHNRQIDRIEGLLSEIFDILNGEGANLGIKGKVNIMWSYRTIFIGVIAANALTIIMFIINLRG